MTPSVNDKLAGSTHSAAGSPVVEIVVHAGNRMDACVSRLESFVAAHAPLPLSKHPGWLSVLNTGMGQAPYCLEAVQAGATRGVLPLAFVKSWLFGRYLVSLPYVNHAGVLADDGTAAHLLIDRAVRLAGELGARYLEMRQGDAIEHPALTHRLSTKVGMRLALPACSDVLWKQLPAKVRNQVRKGQKNELTVAWGARDLLPEFFNVFSRNMRDLGTPTYGKKFFGAILDQFPGRAELCVVRQANEPVAAALLLHGWGVTEVPSASSLRRANPSCANMLMYWNLLERAIARGQTIFDFGRSSRDSSTYQFKKQWGALPAAAEWQYHLRKGDIKAMRPDNPRYSLAIRVWKKLPLFLTRWIGPLLVRGIP